MKTILQTVLLVVAVSTGAQSNKIAPPDTCAQRVALSPDGGLVVTAGTPTHSMVAFKTATATVVWKADLRREKAPVDALAFSPTGEYVIVGYRSGAFEPLGAASGQPISTASIHATDGMHDVAFSRDGRLFAVLTQADKIRVYATSDWKEVSTIEDAGNNGLALSPDGAHVAAGLYSSEVKIWEVQSRKLIQTVRVKGGNRPSFFMDSHERLTKLWKAVWKVEFSPDGKKLATATDGYIQLWNADTGTEVAAVKSGGRTGTLVFSSDGGRIGWATWKGELRTWDIRTRRLIKVTIPTTFGEIAFSPDFTRAYVPDRRKSVRLIDLPSGKQLSAFNCSTQ